MIRYRTFLKRPIHACRSLILPLVLLALSFLFMAGTLAQRGVDNIKKGRSSGRVLYGKASFYANKFNGRKTASGEIFSQKKLTAACNTLPLGTWIKVTNLRNGKWVIVKVNDRLHVKMNRLIDMSRAGAQQLGYIVTGLTRVKVEVLGKKPPRR